MVENYRLAEVYPELQAAISRIVLAGVTEKTD